jgi:hypothetical protein
MVARRLERVAERMEQLSVIGDSKATRPTAHDFEKLPVHLPN